MRKGHKKALITGISGQDGSYLAEFLLKKGYKVYGLEKKSVNGMSNIRHIKNRIYLFCGDLRDEKLLISAIKKSDPDEVYNLASQSFVGDSWRLPIYTADVTGLGAAKLLDIIRCINPRIKFYQASSSEMFGNIKESPQSEKTPFYPRSPYGAAKLFAHWMTINYRESYGMFACSGILFNHESERRGLEFVTRKITHGLARIKYGLQNKIILGNINAKRDWGYAPDFIEAMWLMLQQPEPDDYVIATGIAHSVKEFFQEAFGLAGLDWEKYVKVDKKLFRPAEVDSLVGDNSKARRKLGWKPKTSFKELVRIMVKNDLKLVKEQT